MFSRIFSHRFLLADKVRLTSYQGAIREVVQQGDIVCDIGTGSGVLAFFSALAGAKKVYAIEKDELLLEEARRLAKANGLENKIAFIKGESEKVSLPEKVDVITSELLGYWGAEENLLNVLLDARKRWLKPGGRIVPCWLELYLVPIESEIIWKENNLDLWDHNFSGVDLSPVKNYAVSQRYVVDCSGKAKSLAAPALLFRINLCEHDDLPLVHSGTFPVEQAGRVHGLMGYFKAGLTPSITLSTAPEDPTTHWLQTFFPLYDAVHVGIGDRIGYTIKTIPLLNNVYWQWEVSLPRDDVETIRFIQNNLWLEQLPDGKSFRPRLTQDAEICRQVLNLCNGTRTIEEIAGMISGEHPERYATKKDAWQVILGILRGKITSG